MIHQRPSPADQPTVPASPADQPTVPAAPADQPTARAARADQPTPPAPSLTSGQRQELRERAHRLEPVVLVGRAGVTDAVVEAVDEALLAHELIKVRLHQPEDKRAAAAELAERGRAVLCGLVGHTVILYRPHPTRPRLVLE